MKVDDPFAFLWRWHQARNRTRIRAMYKYVEIGHVLKTKR